MTTTSFLWKKINHIEVNNTTCLGDKISISNDGCVFAIGDTKSTGNYGKIFVFKSSLHSDACETGTVKTVGSTVKSNVSNRPPKRTGVLCDSHQQVKPYDPIKKDLLRKKSEGLPLSERKQLFSLEGEFEEEFLGHAFEISGNGKIFITGEPYYNDCTGRIRLFDIEKNENYSVEGVDFFDRDERSSSSPVSTIASVAASKKLYYFGWDVGINENGDTIGIISNDDTKGNLKIFKKNTLQNQYEELQTIEDEYFTPLSVKFSYSGNILCVSEKLKNKDPQAQTEGRLRVFKYLPALDSYIEFGSHPISGSKLNGLDSLYNFKLNKEGNIIIFGESSYSTNDKKNRGRVRVFKYDESIETWNVIGNEFLGENEGDFCGSAVDINEKGDVIVFSERNFTPEGEEVKLADCGRVRTFKFDILKNEWVQSGQTIQGDFEGDNIGLSLKISANSEKLFIGEPLYDNKGRVRIFEKFYEKGVCLSDGLPIGEEMLSSQLLNSQLISNQLNNQLTNQHLITAAKAAGSVRIPRVFKNDDTESVFSAAPSVASSKASSISSSISSKKSVFSKPNHIEIKAVIDPKSNKIEEKIVSTASNSKKKNVKFNGNAPSIACYNPVKPPCSTVPGCTTNTLPSENSTGSVPKGTCPLKSLNSPSSATFLENFVNFFLYKYPVLILLIIILLCVLLYYIIAFY